MVFNATIFQLYYRLEGSDDGCIRYNIEHFVYSNLSNLLDD